MTQIDDAILIASALCRRFEGLYLRPYVCPAGFFTTGFGSTRYEDGTAVQLTDPPITPERAEALLQITLRRDYLPGVLRASAGLLGHPARLAAMVDFAYNCGVPRYRSSTLRKRIDSEDWAGAQTECMKWTRAGGRVLPGLVRRRAAEAALL